MVQVVEQQSERLTVRETSRPFVVAVGGFSSDVGKTTLLCQLLKRFTGWEAIKTTRGHYRSCGKDPHACCVSHLLEEKPVVRSGRANYEAGKDTGLFWDAGAANVHWVIATSDQIGEGAKLAVDNVKTEGVFIEGNSFTDSVEPDYFVMVCRATAPLKIKSTARRSIPRVSAFYLSDAGDHSTRHNFIAELKRHKLWDDERPVFLRTELGELIEALNEKFSFSRTASERTSSYASAS